MRMIISASRRTDIPAFYMDWLLRRLDEGFLLTRNPMNHRQVSRIELTPEVVDGIVFWSKNPQPMLDVMTKLEPYPYYIQFTLNGYERDVEPGLPDMTRRIDTFRRIADRLGAVRVRWRYDPILVNARYTPQAHMERFEWIARQLRGYTQSVTVSFMDYYAKIKGNIQKLGILPIGHGQIRGIAEELAKIAVSYDMRVESCAETTDLRDLGIQPARCIDDRLFTQITGIPLRVGKDRNQRQACGCVASVDIGAYHCCAHGCLYCYANYSLQAVAANIARHRVDAPLLIGDLEEADVVRERLVTSHQHSQQRMKI